VSDKEGFGEIVDRSSVTFLINQLVRVAGGPQVPPDGTRPVLVVEGYGGSGRSELVNSVWRELAPKAPVVSIDPLAVQEDSRLVVAAAMSGLTGKVLGYRVSFPRLVLAHIAMDTPANAVTPAAAASIMRARINAYRDPGKAVTLIGDIVTAAGQAIRIPGAEDTGQAILRVVAAEIVRRLSPARWLSRLSWKEALGWYAHQDRQLHRKPVDALVQLSLQTGSNDAAVRQDVDDLLVAALLADLRDSLSRTSNRRWNAVLILDDGDAPPAVSFVKSLIRVRNAQTMVPPDPLTVIATSGGVLAAQLTGEATVHHRWDQARLADLRAADVAAAGYWLPLRLADLTPEEVNRVVDGPMWPPDLGTARVSDAVYRLTRGHVAATSLVVRELRTAPNLVGNLDQILSRPGPNPGRSLERHLLESTVAAMSPHRRVDPLLCEDLITMAAARDSEEAPLLDRLLQTPFSARLPMLTSPTLWSRPGSRSHPAMPLFIRYLLLRALARRAEGEHETTWQAAFRALRDEAAAAEDRAGQLHHDLALGQVEQVSAELARLLSGGQPGWLTLLDQVVATPDLRAEAAPDSGGPDPASGVHQLVASLHVLANPCISDVDTLYSTYLLVADAYREVGRTARSIANPCLARATRYQQLADALA
jgi:hypothetical protein